MAKRLALTLALLAAAAPAAEARTANLNVQGESVERWRGETTITGRIVSRVRVYLNGRELDGVIRGKCVALYTSPTVTVKWTGCGDRVRLVAANIGTKNVRVRAMWRYQRETRVR